MPSLRSVDDRFGTQFTIIEGGSGVFRGILSEPGQGEVPSYQFNNPRRLLRVNEEMPVAAGMVIRSPGGSVFMVGNHGSSEDMVGEVFKSFRLFEATGQFSWERRQKTVDPATRLPRDDGLQPLDPMWGAYEPSPEMFDRQFRASFETGRFITNRQVELDDIVDGKKVSRADQQLGIWILSLG